MNDQVTLRDIMALTKEINATVNSIEETLGKRIDEVNQKTMSNKEQISVMENKISNFAKLQLTISVVLSAIATWIGAGGQR